ncbi:hypothetical protein GCM10009613_19870 [Pseudonocardia kongjuensis]|uniref:ACT domain-containing protein n=1 Tax=Pseudonocardia kongjuensis TaxID=102227 RepID=A0ABN1XR70_9PSEU
MTAMPSPSSVDSTPSASPPVAPSVTDGRAAHSFSLLVAGGGDGLTKVLVTLRSRRYELRELHVDLSGDIGRVEGSVEPDGRDPELLLEQLRRVVAVVRAEHG